jgi:hypothetical protein
LLIDPIQMVGDDAQLRGLRGCGYFSGHDTAAGYLARQGGLVHLATASRGFRMVRTMYPPTSGHESTASRHAP